MVGDGDADYVSLSVVVVPDGVEWSMVAWSLVYDEEVGYKDDWECKVAFLKEGVMVQFLVMEELAQVDDDMDY